MGEWDVLVRGASHNEVVKLRARAYGFNTRTTKVLRLGLVCVSIRKQVVLLLVCSFCCSHVINTTDYLYNGVCHSISLPRFGLIKIF
jgi:hypothetical protein